MSLSQLDSLTNATRKMLEADNWTIEALAGVGPRVLARYNGIGQITARRIVAEAKEIWETPKDEPGQATDDGPPMSARVKRIKNANR